MKKKYVAPQTEMSEVELESGFMVASGYNTKIDPEKVDIEVEEYAAIDNDITFD